MKKIFAFMLVLSMFAYCKPTVNENTEEEGQEGQEQEGEGQGEEKPKPTEVNLDDLLAEYQTQDDVLKGVLSPDKLPAEIHDGDEVLATNPNMDKFLSEVTYSDNDGYKTTQVLNYYGGANGIKYNENGEPDENGTALAPEEVCSDIPCQYSIRWTADENLGQLKFDLSEEDWHYTRRVHGGFGYVIVSNLVPNVTYTYSLTQVEGGKVVTQGSFTTTGHVHHVYFKNKSGKEDVRNCRDMGGWKTYDGKTVKYHKIYRGGRLQSSTIDAASKKEIIAEGIRAQLDLRGKSDVLKAPVFKGLAFCAPVIEQGGVSMLTDTKGTKTKECFEFVVNCLRENKPVYFHCSLGRDRTGTFGILLLGLLGVVEGDISKEYELSYFSPKGWGIALSEDYTTFQNTRNKWAYSDVAPYFWTKAGKDGSFADGVEKYLLTVAKVEQKDIDDFRALMLND